MGYEILDLAFNVVLTALLNLSPALIIRYAIRKRRFEEKKHAIMTCVAIAIVVYSVAWFISFSSIGLGIAPKGTPELIYAVVNFAILKPKTKTENKVATPANITTPVATKETISTPTMDANMKEYADIMMPEDRESKQAKANGLTKLNITLIVIIIALSISTIVLGTGAYHKQNKIQQMQEDHEMALDVLNQIVNFTRKNYVIVDGKTVKTTHTIGSHLMNDIKDTIMHLEQE